MSKRPSAASAYKAEHNYQAAAAAAASAADAAAVPPTGLRRLARRSLDVKADESPQPPASVTIDLPELCALRSEILDPLGLALGSHEWAALQKMPSAARDLEWEMVQRLFVGRFQLSYTLMWMQTTIDKRLTLVRILQSRELCGLFVAAAGLLAGKETRYTYRLLQRNEMLLAIRRRCLEALLLAPIPLAGTPFQVLLTGSVASPSRSPDEVLLRMVREASFNHSITMPMLHCFHSSTELALASKTMHASACLARHASTFFRTPRTVAGMTELLATRSYCHAWLQRYFTSGCACDR